MSRKPHIKEKEYNSIKALQGVGISVALAAKATTRAYQTIQRVYDSPDYKAFKLPIKQEPQKVWDVEAQEKPIREILADIESKLDDLHDRVEEISTVRQKAFWR